MRAREREREKERRRDRRAEWSFTSREGASGERKKTEHRVVVFLRSCSLVLASLSFHSPLRALYLHLSTSPPLAPPENPLGQTVFFSPFTSTPENLCLGLAAFSPSIPLPLSFEIRRLYSSATTVVDSQLKPERSAQILDPDPVNS